MDCSLRGFSVQGILEARILEWVAISFSSDPGITPRSPALQADSLLSEPPGKPHTCGPTSTHVGLILGHHCQQELGIGHGCGGHWPLFTEFLHQHTELLRGHLHLHTLGDGVIAQERALDSIPQLHHFLSR